MKAVSSTQKKLLNPGGLLTEAGYTDALIELAAEMKAKRKAKRILSTQKPSKSYFTGFTFGSVSSKKYKKLYVKDIRKINVSGIRLEISKESRQESEKKSKVKAA